MAVSKHIGARPARPSLPSHCCIPADGTVTISREVLADTLLALSHAARRLEAHCKHPGVVDAAVLQHAKVALINGTAALRMAGPRER